MGEKKNIKDSGAKGSTQQDAPEARVKEIAPPGAALKSKSKIVPTPPAPKDTQLKYGFLIGVTEEGKLKFNILGDPQASALLGLARVAEEQIQDIMDLKGNGKFSQLYAKLAELEGKLDKILDEINIDL